MSDTDERKEAIDSLGAWIMRQGIEGTSFDALLGAFSQKLRDAGISVMRVHTTLRAIHPEFGAVGHRWHRDRGTEREGFSRSEQPGDGWLKSPLRHMLDSGQKEFRENLITSNSLHRFPILQQFKEEGGTDYFAARVVFVPAGDEHLYSVDNPPEGMIISLLGDGPTGFSDDDLDDFRRLLPILSLTLKAGSNRQMTEDLLATYLGPDAGQRVMSGDILRGTVETQSAVILYIDLQGFTRMSETLPGHEIIAMLNDYFGEAVPVVEAHGGNVLKFMGDGMLAVFRLDESGRACTDALAAVTELRARFGEVNARRESDGLPVTGFCAALHSGDVLYGNIGASNRLDFTVIGPAVNAAARILGMCGPVDQDIVISAQVAEPARKMRPDLVSLGQYRLRGVAERVELFTLD